LSLVGGATEERAGEGRNEGEGRKGKRSGLKRGETG
jgi:hypothetical protein